MLINYDRILQTFIYDKQLQMQIGSDIYLIYICWGMHVTFHKLQQNQTSLVSMKNFHSIQKSSVLIWIHWYILHFQVSYSSYKILNPVLVIPHWIFARKTHIFHIKYGMWKSRLINIQMINTYLETIGFCHCISRYNLFN